jgi:hypothetical protein
LEVLQLTLIDVPAPIEGLVGVCNKPDLIPTLDCIINIAYIPGPIPSPSPLERQVQDILALLAMIGVDPTLPPAKDSNLPGRSRSRFCGNSSKFTPVQGGPNN